VVGLLGLASGLLSMRDFVTGTEYTLCSVGSQTTQFTTIRACEHLGRVWWRGILLRVRVGALNVSHVKLLKLMTAVGSCMQG